MTLSDKYIKKEVNDKFSSFEELIGSLSCCERFDGYTSKFIESAERDAEDVFYDTDGSFIRRRYVLHWAIEKFNQEMRVYVKFHKNKEWEQWDQGKDALIEKLKEEVEHNSSTRSSIVKEKAEVECSIEEIQTEIAKKLESVQRFQETISKNQKRQDKILARSNVPQILQHRLSCLRAEMHTLKSRSQTLQEEVWKAKKEQSELNIKLAELQFAYSGSSALPTQSDNGDKKTDQSLQKELPNQENTELWDDEDGLPLTENAAVEFRNALYALNQKGGDTPNQNF